MLVLFILLVSTTFINTESSIYLKQSPMGTVLTRGSIGEGQGEKWEDRAETLWDLTAVSLFVCYSFLVFVIVFVSGWIRYINVILEERIYFSVVHVINVLLWSEDKNKDYITFVVLQVCIMCTYCSCSSFVKIHVESCIESETESESLFAALYSIAFCKYSKANEHNTTNNKTLRERKTIC